MLISWCTLEDICAHHSKAGGILALSSVSSYSTVITARLHSAMKDEMSPFGTCSLSYSQCVFSDRLHISYPSHYVDVYCAHLSLPLCTQPAFWLVRCCSHVECFWRNVPASWLLLSAVFPQARGCSMGLFGPKDSLSEGEMECA